MNTPDILAATIPSIDALEQLAVTYHIGGSVASSINGIPRSTIDIDLVADLRLEHVRSLVKQLEESYYIDADAVRDAIRRKSSFNAIHLDTMLKVDVFIPKSRLFDQEELHRTQLKHWKEAADLSMWPHLRALFSISWNGTEWAV